MFPNGTTFSAVSLISFLVKPADTNFHVEAGVGAPNYPPVASPAAGL
jgi:hypothetical protein